MLLADREWKEFCFDEIFIIKRGESEYKQYMEKGNTPYVSASASFNGITDYVNRANRESNLISLAYDGSIGSTFYQNTEWFASEKIVSIDLKNHKLNYHIALFLCQVISNQKYKYSYAYKWSVGIRMMRGKILLPIYSDKNPDYAFMEAYIREQESIKKQKYIDYSKKIIAELEYKKIPSLNEKKWGDFFIVEIFNEVQRGKRLTKSDQINGLKPYVSSSALNNGVDNFISNNSNIREFSNCISLANSGSVGSSFYHPYSFVASDHITHLKNKQINKYIYLFISTLISRLSEKYNFNREINDNRISREKILLPININGTPDFTYMEQYAKNIIYKKLKKYIEYSGYNFNEI